MIPLNNITLNFSELNVTYGRVSDICYGNGQYSPECLTKWFCPQISHYFVNMALSLAILYVISTWLLWAYWRYLNDSIDWNEISAKSPFIFILLGGDPRIYENKVKIELWIRDKLEKLILGFLVIFWWFYH